MLIASFRESEAETRTAITPQSAKHFLKAGFSVAIEKDLGLKAGFCNTDYEHVGTQIVSNSMLLITQADILLFLNEPRPEVLQGLRPGSLIVGHIENDPNSALIQGCLAKSVAVFSMNLIPRLSRAQSMDSLSSQANIGGYRAVLEALTHYHRVVPMMMTAAGMIQPAKVLILGAGVAGLQAIATAKRLGAVVYAFDVRRAAKEQVESLGAEFIEVYQEQDNETKSGYAAEMSGEYQKKQAELIDKFAQMADIIISTALIPGRVAPILILKSTIEQMKPGSIIIDMATSRGGNCEISIPNEIIKVGEITIVGINNLATLVPTTASELYANNLVHLLNLITPSLAITFKPEDEIIQQALLTYNGQYLPFKIEQERKNA
ncbi:MAG: Re/Si-specific NAD(P)(+) transhydrogenase subunit alpha [bacterium]|nr:Re/Si-specific NAD(P)(+) transhydrogenase subunit alpha [bacterium]